MEPSTAASATTTPSPLTKYEVARLLSARVKELEANAPARVPLLPSDTSLFDIAEREINARAVNLTILRYRPGVTQPEEVHLSQIPTK